MIIYEDNMNIINNTNIEVQVALQFNEFFKFNLSLLFREIWYQFLFAMSIIAAVTFPLSFTDRYIMSQPHILAARIIVILLTSSLPICLYFKLKKGFLTDKKQLKNSVSISLNLVSNALHNLLIQIHTGIKYAKSKKQKNIFGFLLQMNLDSFCQSDT